MKYTKKSLNRGARIEAKEHPTFSAAQTRKIAAQHLRAHPLYYDLEPAFEKMLKKRERKK
jgi:hypothetical protein